MNHNAGQLSTFYVDMPSFGARGRRVWVYLPPDYGKGDRRYPVLYMHDGQNLFDPRTAYCGEWGVDKALDSLFREHKTKGAIVIGIDNGTTGRWNEYSPWCRMDGTGRCEGNKYARFIIEDLKPLVDGKFRTLPGRESAGTAGSSLGATISLYMALEYPEVFSKAGLLSPSFWFAREEALSFVEKARVNHDLSIYMDVGTDEGDHKDDYLNDAKAVSGLLSKKKRIEHKFIVDEGGIHNEKAWAARFPAAFLWLFEGV